MYLKNLPTKLKDEKNRFWSNLSTWPCGGTRIDSPPEVQSLKF